MGFIEELESEQRGLNELNKKIDADLEILERERFTRSVDWYIELYERYEEGPLISHGSKFVKYSEIPSDEKRKVYVFRINGFFDYFDERISRFIGNERFVTDFRDISTREICSYIDIMAFNCLYAEYQTEVGKRFKAFLSRYSTLGDIEKDLIWRLGRNIYVHVGDPPYKDLGPSPIDVEKLMTVAKESISNFKEECLDKGIDPAPLVFRVDNLRKLKLKLLNDLKERWKEGDEKDENKYLGYLNQIAALKYSKVCLFADYV